MNKEIEKCIEIQDVVLEKIKFGVNLPLTSEIMQSARIEFTEMYMTDTILAQFRTKILGNKKTVTKIARFKIPANWFQHLKKDCFPKWFIKLFPVKYDDMQQEVEFTASALFPELGTLENKYKIVYFGS